MSKSKEVLLECARLMDPGALRPFVEAFTSRLLSLGHTRLTVSGYKASLCQAFGRWGVPLAERALRHDAADGRAALGATRRSRLAASPRGAPDPRSSPGGLTRDEVNQPGFRCRGLSANMV